MLAMVVVCGALLPGVMLFRCTVKITAGTCPVVCVPHSVNIVHFRKKKSLAVCAGVF